ncbi:hypothetical protein [Phenylobacterium sp.]|jgi:hypothetical protein|uniref:hypothetical protein n=1 Tax=Phenylobacterium sp. TaxID=1871053 RepID=UPI002F925D8F
MFADLPPAPPPMTAQEQSMVMCLSVATTLRREDVGRRLWRVYLGRLRNRDPMRDWASQARPLTEMPYGEFMAHLQRCNAGLQPRRRSGD